MLTLSIIKADTGGFVGHSSVHPSMVEAARERVEDVKGSLLIDGQVATCGDDLSLILTHTHGAEHEGVHRFAFDVFMALTDIAVDLGLYGAGQDLLSDAFSGNLRGLGPGYAELTFRERVSEPVLCFLADKTEPGAWNLPLFRIFADPFNTAGLVIDPKMHAGFRFEVHDLVEGKRAMFDCPDELYDLALYIGAPSRYVIKQVTSRELGEPAAATSTQRLAFMAGRYVGKDDPVMIVRCQSGLPAVGEVLEPFAFPHAVAGCMRGSHHAPLTPVATRDAHPSRFDGPPRVVCLGYQIHDGSLHRAAGHVRRPRLRPGPPAVQRDVRLFPPARALRAPPAAARRDGVHHHARSVGPARRPLGAGRSARRSRPRAGPVTVGS